MAASHDAAALAALQANANLTRVFLGPAPKGTPLPYVAAYVYVANEDRSKMNGPTDWTDVTVTTHCAASSYAAVDIVRRNVRSALIDQRPAVDATLCSRITHPVGDPPDWVDSSGVLVLDAMDQWDYTARPA